jgi:hypothetical protein
MTSTRPGPPDPTPGPTPGAAPAGRAGVPLAAALRLDGLSLHPRLETLLRRVHAAERVAAGAHRRPTFRLMRELLGAAVGLGVPVRLLAECLGTSRGAVSVRASAYDGTIPAELVRQLTDLSPAELDHLSDGELTCRGGRVGDEVFSTTDVIAAVLKTPRQTGRSRDVDG